MVALLVSLVSCATAIPSDHEESGIYLSDFQVIDNGNPQTLLIQFTAENQTGHHLPYCAITFEAIGKNGRKWGTSHSLNRELAPEQRWECEVVFDPVLLSDEGVLHPGGNQIREIRLVKVERSSSGSDVFPPLGYERF